MAASTPLAGLLDRANRVFSLAEQLGFTFRDEYNRQGTGLRTVDPTAWSRHEADFRTFSDAILGLSDQMQTPPDGFAPVAQVLMEAARVAKQIRDTMQTADGRDFQLFLDFRFHFNSIVENGTKAIHEAKKEHQLDDEFAFLDKLATDRVVGIDTTPVLQKPPQELVDAAQRSIPVILADVSPESYQTVVPTAAHLAERMRKTGHSLAAAQWAIHESVLAGRLETGRVVIELPSVKTDFGWHGGGKGTKGIPKNRPAPFDCFGVKTTDALWTWWRGYDKKVIQASPNLARAEAELARTREQQRVDAEEQRRRAELLDLVQSKFGDVLRRWLECLEASGSRGPRVDSADKFLDEFAELIIDIGTSPEVGKYLDRWSKADHDRNFQSYKGAELGTPWRATNNEQLSRARYDEAVRLTDAIINGKFNRDMLRSALEAESLRGTITYLCILLRGLFEVQRFELCEVAEPTDANGSGGQSGRQSPSVRRGGRPKLSESSKAEAQARLNVYALIRAAKVENPTWGKKELHRHFKNNKDFGIRVRAAGLTLNVKIFHAALAWIADNPPGQKTQSENDS